MVTSTASEIGRMPASAQPALQPSGLGAVGSSPVTVRADVAVAADRVVDAHRLAVGAGAGTSTRRRVA